VLYTVLRGLRCRAFRAGILPRGGAPSYFCSSSWRSAQTFTHLPRLPAFQRWCCHWLHAYAPPSLPASTRRVGSPRFSDILLQDGFGEPALARTFPLKHHQHSARTAALLHLEQDNGKTLPRYALHALPHRFAPLCHYAACAPPLRGRTFWDALPCCCRACAAQHSDGFFSPATTKRRRTPPSIAVGHWFSTALPSRLPCPGDAGVPCQHFMVREARALTTFSFFLDCGVAWDGLARRFNVLYSDIAISCAVVLGAFLLVRLTVLPIPCTFACARLLARPLRPVCSILCSISTVSSPKPAWTYTQFLYLSSTGAL